MAPIWSVVNGKRSQHTLQIRAPTAATSAISGIKVRIPFKNSEHLLIIFNTPSLTVTCQDYFVELVLFWQKARQSSPFLLGFTVIEDVILAFKVVTPENVFSINFRQNFTLRHSSVVVVGDGTVLVPMLSPDRPNSSPSTANPFFAVLRLDGFVSYEWNW